MNYGVMGFLMAKDILHLLLPDSKRSSHLLFSRLHTREMFFLTFHLWIGYCNITSVSLLCCSLLSEWDGARCGGMCVGSLSHCDRKCRQRWSLFSLSSAAAGGVGAVFCTADCVAGEEPSSGLSLRVWRRRRYYAHTSTLCPFSFLRLIIRVWRAVRRTPPSQVSHTLACSSHPFLR